MAHASARCVIAHSFGSGFIVIQYDAVRKGEEDWEVRGSTRADRADTARLRRTEGLASRPPPRERHGRPRQAPETGARGSSLQKPEKRPPRRWITRPDANSRLRAAQQYRQPPNRSTAEQADTADAFETVRAK